MKQLVALCAASLLAGASLSSPAAAQSQAALDCVSNAAPESLRTGLANVMVKKDPGKEAETLVDQLTKLSDGCATQHGIADDKRIFYFGYNLARVPRSGLIAQMESVGIKSQPIDDALDFGPGRSNPKLDGDMDEAVVMKIITAVIGSGVAIEKVPADMWEKVGGYAAATSLMYNNLADLKE